MQKQKNPGPQPQRFNTFTETADGLGFKINNCDYIFKYDKYMGWFDEFGNYYNADGLPDEQPDYSSESDDQWDQDDKESLDSFQKQYGPNDNIADEFYNEAVQSESIRLAIHDNLDLIDHHEKEKPLRVNFQIIDIGADQNTPSAEFLLRAYRKKVKGLINVFYDEEDAVTGYFVVKGPKEATDLINLQGQNLIGFDVTFQVEPIEDLKDDPLSKLQLEAEKVPEFVALQKQQKLYLLEFEDGSGFSDKKAFANWIKSNTSKHELVKMARSENNQRKPIVKLTQADAIKLRQALYDGKKVLVNDYKPAVKVQKVQQKVQVTQAKTEQNKQA